MAALGGCGRMLEVWELCRYVRAAVDITASSRRRQRLVVRATVERHEVCEAGENAEPRRDPWLAASNTLASRQIRGLRLTIAFAHAYGHRRV